MEKIVEQRLRVTGSDTWGTWGEFTKDAKQVHDIIQAVRQNISKRSKDRKNHGKEEDEKKGESKRDRSRSARALGTRNGGGGGASGDRNNDHRPLVKNHFKSKVW